MIDVNISTPKHWDLGQPINKPSNYPIIPHPFIEDINIASTSYHIDRIQISVSIVYLDDVKGELSKALKRRPRWYERDNGQTVWEYKRRKLRINVIRYPMSGDYKSQWFSISLLNPDDECQRLAKKILAAPLLDNSPADPVVSLTQIEFAFDFYPENESDQRRLFDAFKHVSILKGMREGAFKQIYEETIYQGHKGSIRKGSKGFKIYSKPKPGSPVRLELNFNRPFLRNIRMNIKSLPIKQDAINICDYVKFKRGVNSQALKLFMTKILKRRLEMLKTKPTRKEIRKLRLEIKREVLSGLGDVDLREEWPNPVNLKPVIEQRDHLKRLAAKYNIRLDRCKFDI